MPSNLYHWQCGSSPTAAAYAVAALNLWRVLSRIFSSRMSCRGSYTHSRGLPTLLLCWGRRWSTVGGGQYNNGFGSCVNQMHVCISPLETTCCRPAGATQERCQIVFTASNVVRWIWVAALNVLRVLWCVFVSRLSSRAHTCTRVGYFCCRCGDGGQRFSTVGGGQYNKGTGSCVRVSSLEKRFVVGCMSVREERVDDFDRLQCV